MGKLSALETNCLLIFTVKTFFFCLWEVNRVPYPELLKWYSMMTPKKKKAQRYTLRIKKGRETEAQISYKNATKQSPQPSGQARTREEQFLFGGEMETLTESQWLSQSNIADTNVNTNHPRRMNQ
eukprot:454831_1